MHSVAHPGPRRYSMRSVNLPVNPPILPMLSKRIDELPAEGNWIFEPKWDGFRALIFRDGDEILIQSRDEKPLNRYFPELLDPLRSQLPARCVLDGEIVIAQERRSRFRSATTPPASGCLAGETSVPGNSGIGGVLRSALRKATVICEANRSRAGVGSWSRYWHPPRRPSISRLQPMKPSVASDWFRRFEGAGLDGVMAKPMEGAYEPGKRVMLKVKHERDCDCVVAGFRWHKKGERTAIGSLLLGLFDDAGALQHVGVCASFTQAKRLELVEFLAPYREDALRDHPWKSWAEHVSGSGEAGHRIPGGQSRWSQGKDLSWEPLRAGTGAGSSLRAHAGHRASATWRSFEDGAPTRSRANAPTRNSKWFRRRSSWRFFRAAAEQHRFFDARSSRHSRVGSSSGSGVSCAGCSSSGTWRRFTRMRVQVDDRPRMESTNTSSTARSSAASGCLFFHLSRPASAASRFGEFATTTSGIFVRAGFVAAVLRARRRHPRSFAFHLAKMRRPRRIAQSIGLVSGRQLEQFFERSRGGIHVRVRIA